MNIQNFFWQTVFMCFLLIFCVPLLGLSRQFGDLVNVSKAPDIMDTLPAIAVDKNNHVYIAWNGFFNRPEAPDGVASDIFYTNNKGGGFTTPVQISVPAGWYSRDPTIAVDSAGNVHIAFRRSNDQLTILNGDDIYYVTNEDGSFDNPVLLVDGKDDYPNEPYVMAPHFPRIHCDSQDNIHLLFKAYQLKVLAGENPYQSTIVYMNNINRVWSDPGLAVEKNAWFSVDDYNSCLDSQDHVHIAFKVHDIIDYIGRDFIYYTNNIDGEFLTPILASSSEHDASEPDLAVNSFGYVHIVYRTPFVAHGMVDLFYVNNVSGNFNSWIAICDDKYYYLPSIAVDESDFVHIAYKRWMHIDSRGGLLFYGNDISGEFDFISLTDPTSYQWYPGSRYFVLGDSSTIHFAFYDWIDSDTEIFYLRGKWTEITNIHVHKDIPTEFILSQNYPNPFNSMTTIAYQLPKATIVKLSVYNIGGQLIETLVNEYNNPGYHFVTWDASNIGSGLYFFHLTGDYYSETKKCLVIK